MTLVKIDFDEIKELSIEEISEKHNIPEYSAINLSNLVDSGLFPLITNPYFSTSKIFENSGLSTERFKVYRGALIDVGRIQKEREDLNPRQYKILSSIEHDPSTYFEISEKTQIKPDYVRNSVNTMRRRGDVRTIRMNLGSKGKYSSHKLIGDLTGRTIGYWSEDEYVLGLKLIDHLKELGEFNKSKKASLSRRLKNALPTETFKIVDNFIWGSEL